MTFRSVCLGVKLLSLLQKCQSKGFWCLLSSLVEKRWGMVLTGSLNRVLGALVCVTALSVAACGGSSSSTTSSTTTTTTGTTSTDSSLLVTLSGQAAATSSDVAANISGGTHFLANPIRPQFSTVGDTVVPEATVELIQIEADGTETTIETTTTDANGEYTIEEVPVCETSSGAADDFYYEVQVTTGDLVLTSPVCPSGDEEEVTANVSPESTVAATIISEVVDVPSAEENPIPSSDQFELIATLVEDNIGQIEESVTVPSMTDEEAESVVDFANGMAGAGGDAEATYEAFQFESEYVALTTDEETTTDELSGYLTRVSREGCLDSDSTGTAVLMNAAADALADAMDSDLTFTPTEIVEAYNAATNDTVSVETEVAEYAELLEAIETAQAGDAVSSLVRNLEDELIDDDTTVAYYTQHDLESADLAADTELTADQAVSFIQTLSNENCAFSGGVDLTEVIAELTGADELAEPTIADVEIYNDSGFGCNGQGQGHFIGNVDLFIPNNTVTATSVVITSTDTAALGGDATIALTASNQTRFVSQADPNITPSPADCVTIDEEVTYTITATFSDSTTATETVTRTHPQTPEAIISVNGVAITSGDTIAVATEMRPVIGWTPPDEALAAIPTAPEGSQVKYTYELSHMNTDTGNFNNRTGCAFVSSGTALYSTDSVIPTIDCDVDACAAADGTTANKIACRINIQTYLVDENDMLLSQGAGAFRRYCVDTNGDTDCGE